MQNLEQVRAAHAFEPAKRLDSSAVSKLPALILTNGLLATAAFCTADGGGESRREMEHALDVTADHLSKCGLIGEGKTKTRELISDLQSCDSHHLQRAIDEALAFISYLKRFAPRKD